MRTDPTGLNVGEHALLVNGVFVLNSGKTDRHIYERAMQRFKSNPGDEILHVLVIAKYSVNPTPIVQTLAETKLNQ